MPLVGSNLGHGRSVRPDPSLTRHIEDLFPRDREGSLDGLLEAAEAAGALMASPGWDLLLELVQAEVATIDRKLDSGKPLDSRAEYAAAHGRRGGLRFAQDILIALQDRAETRVAEQRAKHESGTERPLVEV